MHAVAIVNNTDINIHNNKNSINQSNESNNPQTGVCMRKPISYASVTFRPDNHKLRPIACIKVTDR